jgi:hypothetical protein
MKSRREFRLRLILASLGLIASLLQAPSAFGQAANAAGSHTVQPDPSPYSEGHLRFGFPRVM